MKNILAVGLLLLCINVSAQVKVGQAAPEIALPDTKDSIVHLSSFKGKVVLLDFWASWCGPCRASIPSVIKLYNKYKAQGFEVFGVSIDDKKSSWLKAIKQFNINYTQVDDNGGWYGKVPERYGVTAIPATFLLNKKGEIIAVDMEGEKLEKKVVELLQQ